MVSISEQFDKTMQYTDDCKFKKEIDENGIIHYKPISPTMFNGRNRGNYRPYYKKVSYEVKEAKIIGIDAVGKVKKSRIYFKFWCNESKKGILYYS